MKIILSFLTLTLLIGTNTPIAKEQNPLVSNASSGDSSVQTIFDNLYGNEEAVVLTDIYSTTYFSNLKSNFGNNSHGTCSFVSLGMLLSFYDSYWNDSFVEQDFDVKSNFTSVNYTQGIEYLPFNIESPGIAFEDSTIVGNMTLSEYQTFVLQNSSTFFQSKLISLAESYFGSSKYDTTSNPFGMTFQEINSFLSYYLFTYRSFSSASLSISYSDSYPNNVKSFTISNILNGRPVLIRANSSIFGGHAMIAYDYDSTSGEIYVHPGWKNGDGNVLTHVSLTQLGITDINDAISINVSSAHSHCFNYHSSHNIDVCSCMYSFPQNIKIASGNYRDMNPTFVWDALCNEKWFAQYNPYFKFSILDSSHNLKFTRNCTSGHSITLDDDDWDETLYDTSGNSYFAYVELFSDTYPYWDDYYCMKEFTKPAEYNDLPHMSPIEFGFADAYPNDDYTKTTFIDHQTSNGFRFKTRRYRTGYIHDEYIVMSPKRIGFTEAFIEFKFTKAVDRIDVALSHWRTTSLEGLTSSSGTAAVQQFYGNQYTTVFDMLDNSANLPQDRNNPTVYKICFSQPVYWIRFYSSTFATNNNDSNRGRICIGNIAFYESINAMPLSGYELDYKPSDWFSCMSYTNCYAYALNVKTNPYPENMHDPFWALQPGTSDSYDNYYNPNYLTKTFLESMVGYDSINYGFSFQSIGKYEQCYQGYYKVALVISPNRDYHWYRQNSDGTWSHKPGNFFATNLDYNNNIIIDPENCDRRHDYGYPVGVVNYSVFCGFYQVNVSNIDVNIYGE